MLEVLYEDNHIIAVNKQVSDIVQGDKTGDIPLTEKVKLYLKEKYNKPGNVFVGLTHRIDRPVSGVLLLARTSKALARLNDMFKTKENITKTYWAIVKNTPPHNSGRLDNYLRKNQAKNKSFVCKPNDKGAKLASLEYKVIAKSDNYNLLEINLLTGRHHQIRVQLANINCPIKGDLKYGYKRSNNNGGISLHARHLTLLHPVKKEMITITAPLPKQDIWNIFKLPTNEL